MDKLSFFNTDIYGITCESLSRGRDNITVVQELVRAGVRIIQYREKEKGKREKLVQCRAIAEICRENGALFIVNDDVDVALLCEADGVHVGQSDLPVNEVRRLMGPGAVLGVSADTPPAVAEAINNGADYIGVGPLFATGTKSDAGHPIARDTLKEIVRVSTVPLVAIGGINADNILEVHRAGITLCAMISALVAVPDIGAAVRGIRQKIAAAKQE